MALRMQKGSKGDWPLQTGSRFGRLHDGAPCSQLSELVAGFPGTRIRNVGNGGDMVVDKELGLGQLFPSYEDIAQVIAKRDKVRIFPAGALAQNMLGLSTQVPMNVVYLTDGSNRKVNVKGFVET